MNPWHNLSDRSDFFLECRHGAKMLIWKNSCGDRVLITVISIQKIFMCSPIKFLSKHVSTQRG
jgi:hypothetical protein